MSRFLLSGSAAADHLNIVTYTMDRWGRRLSVVYLEGLEAGMQRLSDILDIGRTWDELGPGLRSFLFENHQNFYVAGDGQITVVRVLHERMDVERQLK